MKYLPALICLSVFITTPVPGGHIDDDDDDAAKRGRVIDPPDNPYAFSPEESRVTVDAETVDLRRVFADLGEEAIEWYQHVMTLSNPFFEGRAPGSRGMEIAMEYLEFYFKQIGLEPAFPGQSADARMWTSYRQQFDLPGEDLQRGESMLSLEGETFTAGEDFTVLGVSANRGTSGSLAFVGYGIEEGRDGYSSFDNEGDLDGRIVLLLRYEPLDDRGKSRWSQRGRFSRNAAIAPKFRALADRGASGIILVNPPGAVDGRKGLETPNSSGFNMEPLEIPVMQVTPQIANEILAKADPKNRDLRTWRQMADRGDVGVVALDEAISMQMSAEVIRRNKTAENLGAVLRGRGDLAEQWVIIGGHYDHVGYGRFGSRPSNRGKLHPGADDNASGTAAILVLADRFKDRYETSEKDNLRSMLFLAFSAEESGLHGSRAYVQHPTIQPEDIALMINMDMIGRLRSNTLNVGGSGTATGFEDLLMPHIEKSGLTVALSPSGNAPTDSMNFYAKDIPVLFAFTGTHESYHQPGDKGYTVNPAGAVKIMNLLAGIAWDVATRPQQLAFRSSEGGEPSGRSYAKVRFGIMPDMSKSPDTGVPVAEVFDGTGAGNAGIEAGDVLLSWNGEELKNTGAMAERMRDHKPGDVVTIVVDRDGRRKTFDVTLQESTRGRRD